MSSQAALSVDGSETRARSFIRPRYWAIWAMVALMWMLAKLPFSVQIQAGKRLGWLLYHALARRRHIARTNLRLCFPELSESERERLLREHFGALGIALFELGLAWWASDERLRRLVKATGLEHIQQSLRRGKGVILLGAHFTNMELGLRLLSLFQPCQMMYRKNNNPLLDYIIHRGRSRHPGQMFPREDVRTLYRSLKQNLVVWYAPDQNYGRRHCVFVPFFVPPAATITTTSRFARKSGAAVIPFVQYRLAGKRGYEVVVLPPLSNFPTEDDVADARVINEVLEREIRRSPEQYLWVHRRFKTRPPGEKDLYRAD